MTRLAPDPVVRASAPPWTLIVLVLACLSTGPAAGQEATSPSFLPDVTGDYLGQAPPGRDFERFAPGIVPSEMYHSVTISPDGREVYWAQEDAIMWTRRMGDRWTIPEPVWFSGGSGAHFLDDAPVVSPDNERLFFNSRRVPQSNTESNGYRYWYSRRTPDGWGPPQLMPDVISSMMGIHWQVSVSSSGTFYFGSFSAGAGIQIYRSRLVDGEYSTPEPITEINRLGHVTCPFIAPDESYLIFNLLDAGHRRSEGHFISFRAEDGSWLAPQALPEFPGAETVFVSRDGRYVFNKAYWASAEMIEDLRPGGPPGLSRPTRSP